ncbi:hypothetical protein QUF72_15085 [Desulfobacterales bacterium HSG2]|nr:hypothetical protein [Desulfobacterales bacterium HSG2]
MNLSELTLDFLEQHCGIAMPKLGDTTLRRNLRSLDLDISDIYPPSGDALKPWQVADLNPDWLAFSGEYGEIQLKENIILPILGLAKLSIPPFLIGKCPISYRDEAVQLEGVAGMVYGRAPSTYTRYIDLPLLCVHEYKRFSNPVTVSRALAQLLGALWIIHRKNADEGCESNVYGLMVKGQNWYFAELHRDGTEGAGEYRAHFDFGGFSIESDLLVILMSLRYYFSQIRQILERRS